MSDEQRRCKDGKKDYEGPDCLWYTQHFISKLTVYVPPENTKLLRKI